MSSKESTPSFIRKRRIAAFVLLAFLGGATLVWKLMAATDIEDLTGEQRRQLVHQVSEWVRSEGGRQRAEALPLHPSERELFAPYFPAEVLEHARVRAVPEMPAPDFAGRIRSRGQRIFDLRRAQGLALDSTLLLAGVDVPPGSPSRRSVLFHELVHAVQYQQLGVDRFFEHYLASLVETGRYADIVFEHQAFELQHRFMAHPNQPFSVAEEVRRLVAALDRPDWADS